MHLNLVYIFIDFAAFLHFSSIFVSFDRKLSQKQAIIWIKLPTAINFLANPKVSEMHIILNKIEVNSTQNCLTLTICNVPEFIDDSVDIFARCLAYIAGQKSLHPSRKLSVMVTFALNIATVAIIIHVQTVGLFFYAVPVSQKAFVKVLSNWFNPPNAKRMHSFPEF